MGSVYIKDQRIHIQVQRVRDRRNYRACAEGDTGGIFIEFVYRIPPVYTGK